MDGLHFIITKLATSHYVLLMGLYILSPIDLLPECILGILGLIDDILVFIILLIFVSNAYYNYLTRQNADFFLNN